MKENLLHSEITEDVIKAFYQVYNALGYGFLEKVYENSLVLVLLVNILQMFLLMIKLC